MNSVQTIDQYLLMIFKQVTANGSDRKEGKLMAMSEEAKKKRNEYMREYRRKNADKIKKHAEAYWERQAQKDKSSK